MAGLVNQVWDYPTMREQKGKINNEAATFEGITARMENIVSVLDRALVGESLVAYKSSHKQVVGQYTRLKEMLSSMATSLDEAATRMQDADANNAAKIKQQFSSFM